MNHPFRPMKWAYIIKNTIKKIHLFKIAHVNREISWFSSNSVFSPRHHINSKHICFINTIMPQSQVINYFCRLFLIYISVKNCLIHRQLDLEKRVKFSDIWSVSHQLVRTDSLNIHKVIKQSQFRRPELNSETE